MNRWTKLIVVAIPRNMTPARVQPSSPPSPAVSAVQINTPERIPELPGIYESTNRIYGLPVAPPVAVGQETPRIINNLRAQD